MTVEMPPSRWTSSSTLDQIPSVFLALFSFVSHLAAAARNSTFWLVLGASSSVGSCAWTQFVVGPRSHKEFRAIQPFRGGDAFILYQGHAWSWLGAYLVLVVLLICNWTVLEPTKHLFSGLGAMSLCPCGLVLVSIPYYCLEEGVRSGATKLEGRLSSLGVAVFGSLAASAASWLSSCQGWSYLAILLSMVGGFIAHFHGGSKLSGWRHLQPLQGGPLFAMLQGNAWTTFGTSGVINLLDGLGILHGLVGVRLTAGLLQFSGVIMLLVSLLKFDGSGSAVKQLEPGSPRALISNIFLLFAIVHFPIAIALTFMGHSSFCSSRGMTWFMLVSMPFAHLVSKFCIDGYSFFQPASGGIEFMIMQSYSWTIFGLAGLTQVVLTVNDRCIPLVTVLLSVGGWVMMSLSVRYFEPPGQEVSRGPSGALTMEVPRGGLADLLMALAGGFGVWSALIACEVVEWNSTEGLAWMLITAIGACNIAGFHILWTWTHGILSMLLLATGDERGIAIFACLGVTIAATWYGLFATYFHLQVPVRAVRGWSKWFIDAVGPVMGHGGRPQDWYPSYIQPVVILVGFHFIDIALHFMPPLMLLQVCAELITPFSVIAAHIVSRLWFFLVSTHHYAILPKELAKNGLRVAKYHNSDKGCLTMYSVLRGWVSAEGWVDVNVLSDIYGMDPPLPKDLGRVALTLDFISFAVLLALSFLPQPLRTSVFFTMGLGPLVSIRTMVYLMFVFGIPGVACFAVGMPISFLNWPNPHPIHMDMYKEIFETTKQKESGKDK